MFRSLPILLIVLALLSLSDARKCYAEATGKIERTEITCSAGITYCAKGESGGKTLRLCADSKSCTSNECKTLTLEGESHTGCCCSSDLCNPAAAPTVLISLAALAAMIAARF